MTDVNHSQGIISQSESSSGSHGNHPEPSTPPSATIPTVKAQRRAIRGKDELLTEGWFSVALTASPAQAVKLQQLPGYGVCW